MIIQLEPRASTPLEQELGCKMWDCFGHTAIWVNMSVWRTSAGCSLCLSKYCKSIQLYCINEVVWWTGFEYNLDSITSLKDYVLEYIAKERRRIADVCFDKYKNRISDFLMESRWSDYVDWLWINQDQDLRDLTFCVQSHFFSSDSGKMSAKSGRANMLRMWEY